MMTMTDEYVEKEQLSLLSGRLEMIVNNNLWKNSSNKIISTAKMMNNALRKLGKDVEKKEVDNCIRILTKAKVKVVMANDDNYYKICSKLDGMIYQLEKMKNSEAKV